MVSVSLAEGETIRRLMHSKQGVVKKIDLSMRDIEGSIIDSTERFVEEADSKDQPSGVSIAIQCLRFFNCEMYFTDHELDLLMRGLDKCDVKQRLTFFSECLRLRKRERNLWADTPLAKVFTEKEDWHLLRARAKIQQMETAIRTKKKLDARAIFCRFDDDHDGCLSYEELQRAIQAMRLGFAPRDVAELVRLADRRNVGYVQRRVCPPPACAAVTCC